MAANSTEEWGMVESKGAPEGNFLWWYGQYENEYWNGEYKTIEDGLLKADLLGFNANKRKVTSSSPWKPETGQLACGKSLSYMKIWLMPSSPDNVLCSVEGHLYR